MNARAQSEVLAASASMLSKRFRLQGHESDRIARIPDSLFEEIQRCGILDAFLPRQYGGLELSPLQYQESIIELSSGDGGMGWAVNLLAQGPWMLKSLFRAAAIEEVLGTSGGARIAQMVMPRVCEARRVDGGIHIVESIWGFNSAVHHANWDILGITVSSPEQSHAMAVLPISDVEILNDWDVMGLRGSGSSSVRVRDVFVPEHRLAAGFTADPETAIDDDEHWMYRAEFVPLASNILTLPIIGMARAMLEIFIHSIHGRPILYTAYADQSQAPVTHLEVGRASAEIDAAQRLVQDGMAQVEAATRNGETLSTSERLRLRRDTGFANQLLWEAVDRLAAGAGGALARSSNLLGRFWRDTRIATLHAGLCSHTAFEAYGRFRCGLDPATTLY